MTQAEWKHQRSKAAANLELLTMKRRSGLVSLEDVTEAKRILQALATYQPEPEAVPASVTPTQDCPKIQAEVTVELPGVELPAMPVTDFTRLLDELTLQKSEAHKQLCIRSNKLHLTPDNESAKELVDEIDHYYDQRTALAIKINFLKANGRLPEDVAKTAETDVEDVKLKFMENLPADKYELSKQLALKLPNLSKARAQLVKAKDPVTKVKYSQKVAKLEAEIALLRSAMKGMD